MSLFLACSPSGCWGSITPLVPVHVPAHLDNYYGKHNSKFIKINSDTSFSLAATTSSRPPRAPFLPILQTTTFPRARRYSFIQVCLSPMFTYLFLSHLDHPWNIYTKLSALRYQAHLEEAVPGGPSQKTTSVHVHSEGPRGFLRSL